MADENLNDPSADDAFRSAFAAAAAAADDKTPVTSNGVIAVDAPADDDRVPKLEAVKAALERKMSLLSDGIRALQTERSDLRGNLGDAKDGAARAEAELKATADRIGHLEDRLRSTQDDLVAASTVTMKSEERALILERKAKAIMSEKADLHAKILELVLKVSDLEEEVCLTKLSRMSAEGRGRVLASEAEELLATVKAVEGKNAELEAKLGELKEGIKETRAKAGSFKDTLALWAATGVVAAVAAVALMSYRKLKRF